MIHPLKKSASLIIIDDEGKILLLKRLSKMSFANAFVFPGGKCEESDKVQAKS